jgi:hypothetical protein
MVSAISSNESLEHTRTLEQEAFLLAKGFVGPWRLQSRSKIAET